jgi:hypothetical protein
VYCWQQQNFSLEALSKRDALPDPFVITTPTRTPDAGAQNDPAQAAPPPGSDAATQAQDQAAKQAQWNEKMIEAFDLEMAQ